MRWVKVFSDFVVDLFWFLAYLFTETIELLIKKIIPENAFSMNYGVRLGS